MKSYRFLPILLGFLSVVSAAVSCKNNAAPAPTTTTPSEESKPVATLTNGTIAYVNLDSLLANYKMTEDKSAEIQEKASALEKQFNDKQKSFERRVKDFQNKAEKGLETRAKLAEIQQSLAVEEQNLLQTSEQLRLQLAEEQAVMNRQLLEAVQTYLVEYNKEHGYLYILANSFGGNILLADPSLDITSEVLEGLNAAYKKEEKTE